MSTATSATSSDINFSFKGILDGDELEIPELQQMIVKGIFRIDEFSTLILNENSEIALI